MKLDNAVRKEMRKNHDNQGEGFDLNNIMANEYEKMKIMNNKINGYFTIKSLKQAGEEIVKNGNQYMKKYYPSVKAQILKINKDNNFIPDDVLKQLINLFENDNFMIMMN